MYFYSQSMYNLGYAGLFIHVIVLFAWVFLCETWTVFIFIVKLWKGIFFLSSWSVIQYQWFQFLETPPPPPPLTLNHRRVLVATRSNNAIRDGKYLAPSHTSAWQRSPHYNRTQEVPMKKYLKEIVGPVVEIYAIELLGSMSTDEAWRHLRTFLSGVHWHITIVMGSQRS